MTYHQNYQYEMPPTSNTRINYQPNYQFNQTPPLPYVAEAARFPSYSNQSIPVNTNPCRIVSLIVSIMLAIICTFYTIVLFTEFGKLPCKPQMMPFLALGVIASIGLALIALLTLVYFANVYQKVIKIMVYIISVISLCGAIGFLIFVWVMRNRHIGVCYIKNNFSEILIAIGFIEAALAIFVPALLNFI